MVKTTSTQGTSFRPLAAVFFLALVAFLIAVTSTIFAPAAAAEPNVETPLPSADGVVSVEAIAADEFGATQYETVTVSTPHEIKYLGPGPQQVICSVNGAGGAGPCEGTVFRFIAQAGCVYIQYDGIVVQDIHSGTGWREASSDVYVCRTAPTVPPTTEPPTTEPPTTEPPTTEPPTTEPPYTPPVVHCEPPYAPGILDDHGNPTSCVNNGPMPPITCPEGEVKDSEGFCYVPQPPCPEGTTPVYIDGNVNGYIESCETPAPTVAPTPTSTSTAAPVVTVDNTTPTSGTLASTGADFTPMIWVGISGLAVIALGLAMIATRKKQA